VHKSDSSSDDDGVTAKQMLQEEPEEPQSQDIGV
jgi:hypothetical protein